MGKKRIIFSKLLWVILTVLFVLLFVTLLIGQSVAYGNAGALNSYFGLKDYRLEQVGGKRTADSEYYKSDYVLEGKTYLENYNSEDKGKNLTGYYDSEKLWEDNTRLCERVEEEGAVLLWNNNGALPLADRSNVSLFSYTSADLIISGTGSGVIDSRYAPSVKEAFESAGLNVNEKLWSFYESVGPSYKRTQIGNSGGASTQNLKANDVPWSKIAENAEVMSSIDTYGGAAVFFIGRSGGEEADLAWNSRGTDGIGGNYLEITEVEKTVLERLIALKKEGKFTDVIVLLNTGNAMQMNLLYGEYGDDIDACMFIGQTGAKGINGVANLLVGKAVPSGRLADTYRYDNLVDPVLANFGEHGYTNASQYKKAISNQTKYVVYQEGIYVGYKYYETRYEDYVIGRGNAGEFDYGATVAFPFGHGESYADFDYSGFDVTYHADETEYEVRVTVTNDRASAFSGRETVQIYLQKEYTEYDRINKVENSAVDLVGFGKTAPLAPGESEELVITVPESEFKSYSTAANDGKGSYIVEAGDYYLTAATDAHDAVNNILTAKNFTPQNTNGRMDAVGNKDLTYKTDKTVDDFQTWSKSEHTGENITNKFDFADLNKYEHSPTSITYLTRSDWTGTFPTKVSLALNDGLFEDMAYDKDFEENITARNPTYGAAVTYGLVELKGLKYDAEEWDIFLNQMTFKQQAELIANGYRQTIKIENLSVPSTRTYDGPVGISAFAQSAGFKTMGWPCLSIQAGTFDTELIRAVGEGFGEDMLQIDVQGVYGPGANIHRSTYGGRNFEYYSEDAFLSGIICREMVLGIQSKGGVVHTKHFALNDQETNRHGVCTWANEQTVREIYLKAFEYQAVGTESEHGAYGIMTSYNRLGALWTGGCAALLEGVARDEWGYDGYFLTDYCTGDMYSCLDGVLAGNDCWLYGNPDTMFDKYEYSPTVKQAMRNASHRILYSMVLNSNVMNGIDKNTRVVPIRVWWENALLACVITFGVLALASGTMLALSIMRGLKKTRSGDSAAGKKE